MSLTIDLPHDTEDALRRLAEAEGVSVEECLVRLVNSRLGIPESQPDKPAKSLADVTAMILDHFKDLPPEAFEGLPHDGASQVDHYIHGTPKRNG